MARTYRTMQGKEIDMDKLMARHELMPAIGNASVNARGDEIGPGGQIVKKREQVMSDYYELNPKATQKQVLPIQEEVELEKIQRGTNENKRKS